MNINISKTLCIIALFAMIIGTCATPPKAEAKISFNRFNRVTRRIIRKVGKGTKFVVKLPDKATRWMGPVLGPIAAVALTGKIANSSKLSKIFDKARRINQGIDTIEDVEAKQQYLKDLRDAYRTQASDLRKQADEIRESRRNMLNQLSSGDITYEDYKNHVVALNDIAEAYEETANKFDNAANKMNPEDLAGIISKNLLNTVLGEVKNAVIYETSKELNKLVDPNVIQRLVNNEGVNLDTLIDAFASSQIDKQLGGNREKIDTDALKDRVRDKIKNILKENREDLKENWKEKIEEIINESKKELEDEKSKLPEVDTSKKPDKKDSDKGKETEDDSDLDDLLDEDATELDNFFEPDPDSADKCNNGYEWDIKIGKCIQSNCNSETIPNAHYSYVKDCLCGSSGSMYENPDDPNKECSYPLNYEPCPGCVYACVGVKDECPEKK